MSWEDFISSAQEEWIIDLYEKLGQDYDIDEIQQMTRREAHTIINELKEMVNTLNPKKEEPYWYE